MSKLNIKLGIVGCGNMARGILAGVLAHRVVRPGDVSVYDTQDKAAKAFKKAFGVKTVGDVYSVFQNSDVVFLAVKPQNLSEALSGLRSKMVRAKCVISILAGTPLSKVSALLPKNIKIVRAMPNLGAAVGTSFTAVCGRNRADVSLAKKLFEACGRVVILPEGKMNLITVLSGSGPAYFFFLMELLAIEGVKYGLSKSAAKDLAVQTALGASKLAAASRVLKPSELRRAVTSKGGTTEAVIGQLELKGLRKIFSEAIHRGLRRAHELGRRS